MTEVSDEVYGMEGEVFWYYDRLDLTNFHPRDRLGLQSQFHLVVVMFVVAVVARVWFLSWLSYVDFGTRF